jgi:hypothetical protein
MGIQKADRNCRSESLNWKFDAVWEIRRRGAEGNSLLEHGEDPCFFLLTPQSFFLGVGDGRME